MLNVLAKIRNRDSSERSWVARVAPDAAVVGLLLSFWLWHCRDVLRNFFTAIYQGDVVYKSIDTAGMLWMSWWTEQALSSPQWKLFFSPFLNFPIGSEVMTYDVAFSHVVLSGMLRPFLGPAGGFNAVFLLAGFFSLFGIYVLLRQVLASRLTAGLLALLPIVYGLFPLWDIFDLEVIDSGFFSLSLACWLALLRKNDQRLILPAGLLIAATMITQMYYGIALMIVLATATVASFAGLTPYSVAGKDLRKQTMTVAGLGFLMVLPYLLWILQSVAAMGPVWKLHLFPEAINNPNASGESWLSPNLWLSGGVFVLMAVVAHRRRTWFLFALLVVPMLFFISKPFWTIGRWHIPTPVQLLTMSLPYFWRLSSPARFCRAAVILATLFLAGWIPAMQQRWSLKRWPAVLPAVASLVVGLILIPVMNGKIIFPSFIKQMLPMHRVIGLYNPIDVEPLWHPPEVIADLGEQPSPRAIFEVNCEKNSALSLMLQTVHEKPVSTDCLRPHTVEELSPLAKYKKRLCSGKTSNCPSAEQLRQLGVRYVMFYLSKPLQNMPQLWPKCRQLYGEPVYGGQRIRLYEIGPKPQQ